MPPFFPLHKNFFGLPKDYRLTLNEEILAVMVSLKQPYSEILKMPILDRRFFLTRLNENTEEATEVFEEKEKNKTKDLGNGRRSTII